MERVLKINPQTVVSVVYVGNTFKNEEIKVDDSFKYICSLVTNERVLMEYDPLKRIKQFIKYGYAVVKNKNNNLRTEKVQIFINYYGLEVIEFINSNSKDEIVFTCDTIFQAINYIHKHSLDKFCA
jgi:hypothetical protein